MIQRFLCWYGNNQVSKLQLTHWPLCCQSVKPTSQITWLKMFKNFFILALWLGHFLKKIRCVDAINSDTMWVYVREFCVSFEVYHFKWNMNVVSLHLWNLFRIFSSDLLLILYILWSWYWHIEYQSDRGSSISPIFCICSSVWQLLFQMGMSTVWSWIWLIPYLIQSMWQKFSLQKWVWTECSLFI